MPKKHIRDLTDDEWIEQYGFDSLRYRELGEFMKLLERFPAQYSSIRAIMENTVGLTDEVYDLLERGAPPVVFEKLRQWHTMPEQIRFFFLKHVKLRDILNVSLTDVWDTIPSELVHELQNFREPSNILRAAEGNSEFTAKYRKLPEEVRSLLRDSGHPGSIVLELKPHALDSVPKQLHHALLEFTSVSNITANPHFDWDDLSPQEQAGLMTNTGIGSFLEHFDPAVWHALPPRVRELAAANMKHWKNFFNQPDSSVWRDVPDTYLELSVMNSQTVLFSLPTAVDTFLHVIPEELREACIRSGRLDYLIEIFSKSDAWNEFPSLELARKVIDSANVYHFNQLATRQGWDAIPSQFHDMLTQHPTSSDIFVKARPEFWNLVPAHILPRLIYNRELLELILGADYYADCRPQIEEFLQEERGIQEWQERLAPDVPSDIFRAVMLPLFYRHEKHPSQEAERLIERQAERLRRAYTDLQDAPEALPTIGYELEFENLYADREDYEWLQKRGAWKLGGDKAYEIASNVFPSGRLAALSMFSLLHSGLVAQSELQPALFSLHVNLGIPPIFVGRLPSDAQAWELQQSLLPGHTSAERLSKGEWVIPVEVHSRLHVEGDAAGRVELRVHDLHDMWVYALLQKAPEATRLWLADYAEQQGVEYMLNQRELAADWQRARTEQQLNREETPAPELLGKRKFSTPKK